MLNESGGRISTPLSVHGGSQQPRSVTQSPADTEGTISAQPEAQQRWQVPSQRGWALGTLGSPPRLSLAPQETRSPSIDSQRPQACVRSLRGHLAAARGLCPPPMPACPPWPRPRPGTSAQDGPAHPPEPRGRTPASPEGNVGIACAIISLFFSLGKLREKEKERIRILHT